MFWKDGTPFSTCRRLHGVCMLSALSAQFCCVIRDSSVYSGLRSSANEPPVFYNYRQIL